MQKNILLLHTGGTFGMAPRDENAEVKKSSPEFLANLFQFVPELKKIANLQLEVVCNLDSSDFSHNEWIKLAKCIASSWDKFDGFVIIHGTDTMAYTANALAYFMSGLTKSVVLTGSQRPLSELRNDARANIIDAVELATKGIPEVMICFDSKVHLGTRATKASNEHLHAFKSNNSPLLGYFGVHFHKNTKLIPSLFTKTNHHAPLLNTEINSNIIALDCIPGAKLNTKIIDVIVNSYAGIVIRAFGSGNLPIQDNSWLDLCAKAKQKNVPVIIGSYCQSGSINLDAYENARVFRDLNVISGHDMSFESMSIKLMIMLGRKIPALKWHEFFATPLANECSIQ